MYDNSQAESFLTEAIAADGADRPALLQSLAIVLAEADPFAVAAYAERVKAAGLAGKTEFREAVRNAGRTSRAAESADDEERKPRPTDDELAARWIEQSGDGVAFGLGHWRRYERGFWPAVPPAVIDAGILEICQAAKAEGVRPKSGLIDSVNKLALMMRYVRDEVWNSNPDILVMRNGTLDLRTYELREHSLADYATIGLPYDYDPEATAPVYDYAVHANAPDAADFIQEFAGYCLTTDTALETALWFHGLRGSGKSTVLHGFNVMLCGLAGTLGLAAIEKSQFALGKLPGLRLVVSTEQPETYMQASWVLDAIISGEKITVEEKYAQPYDITPYAKILWAMNSLPRIGSPEDGIFRRVKVVGFPVIPEGQRDETLKARISEEAPGILNWAIEGLKRLRARGRFDIPDSVQESTQRFVEENDKPAAFLAECCLRGSEYQTQSQTLYDAYSAWCLSTGHKPSSGTAIARDWERLGAERKRINGKTWWHGIGLRSNL